MLALLEDTPAVTTRTIERAGVSPSALRDDLDTLLGRYETERTD